MAVKHSTRDELVETLTQALATLHQHVTLHQGAADMTPVRSTITSLKNARDQLVLNPPQAE